MPNLSPPNTHASDHLANGQDPLIQIIPSPQDFALIGWTMDPLVAQVNAQPATAGRLYLFRFRCAVTATLGHIGFGVGIIGGTIVSGQNFLMIYDTGQAAGAGTATLLGTTADQSSNFGAATSYSVAVTPQSAGSLNLTVGQDYFVGYIGNATTMTKFIGGSALVSQPGLINTGLATTASRLCYAGAGGYTTTPPTSVSSGWTQSQVVPVAFTVST